MGQKQYKALQQSNIIKIIIPKIDYFQGENISGEILLKVGIPVSFTQIRISFILYEGWYYETGGENSNLYNEINNITLKSFNLNVREILNKELQPIIILNQGDYFFPFNYKLSNLISPNCEYYINSGRGFLRYILSAEIISPNNKTREIYEHLIMVKASPKILKSPLNYISNINIKRWGLVDKGSVSLGVNYNKNYAFFDEIIPITVLVDNTKSELDVTLIKIILIRNVNFLKMKYSKSFYFQNNVIEIKSNVNVLKNTKEVFNFSINLRDTSLKKIYYKNIDDPYPDTIDLNYLLPTVNGNLIRCDYVIKISCHFETLVPYENRPRVFLPLNIGHQGKNNIRMSILQNNEKNNNIINEEKIDIENDLMYDDFVVIDDDNENEKDYKSELILMDREFSVVNNDDNYFQSMPLKNIDYQNNILKNNKNINKYPKLNEKNNIQINNQNNNFNPNFNNQNYNNNNNNNFIPNHNININNNYNNFIPNQNININNNYNNFNNYQNYNQNIQNSNKINNDSNSQNFSNNHLNNPNLDNKNKNIYNINQNYNNNEYQNLYPIFSDSNS